MLTIDIDLHGTIVPLVPLAGGEETIASRRAAVTGEPPAAGIAEMVDRRIDSLPLYDSIYQTTSGSRVSRLNSCKMANLNRCLKIKQFRSRSLPYFVRLDVITY